jgi:hypothetical protein
MKHKILPIYVYSPKTIILSFLAIASLFSLSGCINKYWVELAEEKALPSQNCEYWKIQRVVSAIKHENSDISICVRLVNPDKTENPKLKTITLPFSELTGEIIAGTKLESSSSGCPLYSDWYPVEKSKTGCDKIDSNSVSTTTVIPIEKVDAGELDINYIGPNQLSELLNAHTKDQQITGKIYEVKNKSSKHALFPTSKHALFVYWPAQINQQAVQPIIIAGTYEDKSTYAYWLLTIPYIVFWTAMLVIVFAPGIVLMLAL